MEKIALRIIEILAGEIAQKTVQIAQLTAALEAAQQKIAELETPKQPDGDGNGDRG